MAINGRELEYMGGALVATDGATTVTGFKDGGCIASATRTGAGAYTIAISPAQAEFENIFMCQVRGGAGNANVQVAWSTAAVLLVTTFVGAVATDEAFQIMVFRVRRVS